MPAFKIEDRFGAVLRAALQGAKGSHVTAFFGGDAGGFHLTAVDILVARLEPTDNRQDLLRSETPGQESEERDAPAALVRWDRCAVRREKARPSMSVALFRRGQSLEDFGA